MLSKLSKVFVLIVVLVLEIPFVNGQSNWHNTNEDRKKAVVVDTINKQGFTLIWINKDKDFDPLLAQRLIDVHFVNYPKLVKKFNKNSRKEITFVIDPEYDGIAATAGGIVRFNPQWFAKNPNDIDIVTHEVMHIVQAYPSGSGPGWLVEGIADYIRDVYGVDNVSANWALPNFNANQHYTNSYRITARFLKWIEENKSKGIVQKLDRALRDKTYSSDIWAANTKMTLDELWEAYKKNSSSK